MKRATIAIAIAALAILAGCGGTPTAVQSEISAEATVEEVERHDGATEAHINLSNTQGEAGVIGLHIHYWEGPCSREDGGTLLHTHQPTVYLDAGETRTMVDTYEHNNYDRIDCVSVHLAH